MKAIANWLGKEQMRDGMLMLSVLAVYNCIDCITFGSFWSGILAGVFAVLVAVSYEGGKLIDEDGRRG